MIRQSSSRNQRSKGVRVKHILQICMLLAVCFWLIYQVKHSYDKRKHFEDNDGEILGGKSKFDEVVKLGRKDIRPRDEELSTNNEKIDDEEVDDEETLAKGDENLEETQEELERKRKEEGSADIEALLDGTSRGEGAAGGRIGDDDDIDEQDVDKAEKEGDGDDAVVEVDKDIEKDEENEIDEKDGDEDNEHQLENDGSLDDQGHDSSGDRHEAREEHYRADDASSAVAHVGQNILSENPDRKNVTSYLDAQELDSSLNEANVAEEQPSNITMVFETPPNVLDKNDTSGASSGTVDSTPQNKGHVLESSSEKNSTTGGLSTDRSSNATKETDYSPIITSTTTTTTTTTTTDTFVEQDVNSNSAVNQDTSTSDVDGGSSMTNDRITNKRESFNKDDEEHEDAIQDNKDTEEDSILSSLNDDETLRDPLISEEEDKERESRIDLDTLPELRTEGTDSDDAATE